jgi:hypothetical protein
VRLGTCIAVELIVGAATLGALGAGSAWGVAELREYLRRSDAAAAEAAETAKPVEVAAAMPAPRPEPKEITAAVPQVAASIGIAATEPAIDIDEVAPPPPDGVAGLPAWNWKDQGDADALAPLVSGKIVRVKFNRGGSSLSLRIDFDNGARAAFKPEQIHPQSNPRREIAAYRLDRLLGLNRVPPAVGRTFTVEEIVAAVPPKERFKLPRLDEEAIDRNGRFRGELSWWIPVIENGRVGGFEIDETDGIVTWKRHLRPGATIPERDVALVRQISDMIVFDFLLDNTDRWSGSNAKVSEDGTVLYFMDNTMAVTSNPKAHRKSRTYLSRVATFSRRLIGEIRALTEEQIRDVLEHDMEPFDFLATKKEVAALMSRRDKLIEYVDALIAEHGEDKVLAFP